MNELLQSIKHLKEMHFRSSRQLETFSMSAIEKIRAELEEKIDKPMEISRVETNELLKKWLAGDRDFRRKEIKILPFVMYDGRVSLNDVEEMLGLMDFSRETHLKNLIAAYLINYDDPNKNFLLGQKCNRIFKSRPRDHGYHSKMLKQIFEGGRFLFVGDCLKNMSALYAKHANIDEAMSEIGLTDFFKGSNFIRRSLKYFLCSTEININKRLNILYEIAGEANGIYEGIIRSTADVIIPDVEAIDNPSEMSVAKKNCLEIFYKELGDPRFGSLTYRWDGISQRTKEIFLHWLAESDLDLFFKIIEQTAVDRMWRYRKDFWKSYLPYIANTWVFLGMDAQHTAKKVGDKILHHGNLSGGSRDQSVLVFQIGEYIFVEWSHNGKLRAYYREAASNWFGAKNIKRTDIIYSRYIEEWIHYNPANYTWQRNVSRWISVYCGL